MTIGDSKQWDDFIESGGVALVMKLVLDAWTQIVSPTAEEHEDHTSIRLYAAMVKQQNRQTHRFLIRYQDVEVDTDLAKETGKKDIVFFPGHDGSLYFCLEAKRLNARVKGVMHSLADEYVKEGMQRFAAGKYSRDVHHGGMLGYVLDGDVPRAMANVLNNIRRHHAELGIDAPGDWSPSPYLVQNPCAKETSHCRSHTSVPFSLQHLFVSVSTGGEPSTPSNESGEGDQ